MVRSARSRVLALHVLPLVLAVAPLQGLAGQVRSGVATVELRAVALPGARFEPREPGPALGLPFSISVNAPYRLEIRRPESPGRGDPIPLRLRTSAGVEEELLPGGRTVWQADGPIGAVPLEALRQSLPPPGLDAAGPQVVVYLLVAPVI